MKKNCNVGCPDCEDVCKTKNINNKNKNTNNNFNVINDPEYKCAICGKTYKTVEERINCESKCLAECKEAEKRLKEEKLKREQQARYDHINQLLDQANQEVKAYLNDYECFTLKNNYYYLRYIFKSFFLF